jgi:serine/threonine protein kinase/WD40 repeat protein
MSTDSFDSSSVPDALGPIFESFLARLRRGEHPSIKDYAERYPDQAAEINELLPPLVEMEQASLAGEFQSSATGGSRPETDDTPADFRLDDDLDEFLPDRLGDYKILRKIGGGGMGVVYEAERVVLRRPVALKVMRNKYRKRADYLRWFLREAPAAAGLHHTNIVSVLDYGQHEGIPYYAMQLIAGHSLDRVLDDVKRLEGKAARSMDEEDGAEVGQPTAPMDPPPGNGSPGDASLRSVSISLLRGVFDSRSPAATDRQEAALTGSPEEAGATQPEGPGASRATTEQGEQPASSSLSAVSGSSWASGFSSRYQREVARIGAQVADALDYSHKRKVIHRDIKPQNILLDALGNAWITDFGLALKQKDEPSTSQAFAGTLRYMAPERLRGKSDGRDDIYALGATLYEFLALRQVFDGSNPHELLRQIENDQPVPLHRVDRRIHPDLAAIIATTLAKDPADRYATAGELRDELRRFIEGRPVKRRPVPAYARFGRWCKRNPLLAVATITAGCFALALAVRSTIADRADRQKLAVIENQRQHLRLSLSELEKANRKARLGQFEAQIAQARAQRFSGRQGQRFDGLKAISEARALLDRLGFSEAERDRRRLELRNLAIACLALPDFRNTGHWSIPEESVGHVLSPDQTRLAWWDAQGNLVVQRTADGAVIGRLRLESKDEYVHFVNKGGDLLLGGLFKQDVHLWTPGEAAPYRTWHIGFSLRSLIPSADGRLFVMEAGAGHLQVYDIATGRLVNTFELPPYDNGIERVSLDVVFSPDGRWMAVNSGQDSSVIRIFELETGRLLPLLKHSAAVMGMAWYPDGKTLATGTSSSGLEIWDLADGQPRRVGPFPDSHEPAPVIVIDSGGELLACASRWRNNGLRVFHPRTGRLLFQKPGLFVHLGNSSPLSDASLKGYVENSTDIIGHEFVPGHEYRTLARRPLADGLYFDSVSVHPGGRLLGAGNQHGVVLFDLETGDEAGFLPIGESDVWFEPTSGALWTGSRLTGVSRWPVEARASGYCIGPPDRRLAYGGGRVRGSRDGRVVVAARSTGAVLLLADQPGRPVVLKQPDVRWLAVSPDGRWVATYTPDGGSQLWDARSWSVVRKFDWAIQFSPEGRWLCAKDSQLGYRLWESGTWKPGPAMPSGDSYAFSSDSTMLAVEIRRGIILLNTATGRELATLDGPTQDTASSIAFSPDDSRLIATGNGDPPSVHVWDLRLIRRELTETKLDWDAPSVSDPQPPTDRLKVDIVGTTRLVDEKIRDADTALAKRPGAEGQLPKTIALQCNNLAWELATGPSPNRDLQRALTLARHAVELVPGDQMYLNTLGVVLYRAQQFAEALPVLQRSLAAGNGQFDAHDLFFLAMARHRLGDRAAARGEFDRAVQWLKDHPNQTSHDRAELSAFRAEAESVLAGPAGEMPDDVFAGP